MKQDEYTKEEKMAILLGCGMMMHILEWILIIILLVSCSGPSKLQKVQAQQMTAEIGLVEQYEMQDQSREGDVVRPDTLVVQDAQGNEMILMKAIKDENGDMVATDVISAAVVEARFRNVAERHGKVDIAFQIRVPKEGGDGCHQRRRGGSSIPECGRAAREGRYRLPDSSAEGDAG